MKTVKALKSFSNANFSMYAGEIRELPDQLANSYISDGLVKEYFEPDDVTITPILTEGTDIATATINGEEVTIKAPAGGGGGGSNAFVFTFTVDAQMQARCDKTNTEIFAAKSAGYELIPRLKTPLTGNANIAFYANFVNPDATVMAGDTTYDAVYSKFYIFTPGQSAFAVNSVEIVYSSEENVYPLVQKFDTTVITPTSYTINYPTTIGDS